MDVFFKMIPVNMGYNSENLFANALDVINESRWKCGSCLGREGCLIIKFVRNPSKGVVNIVMCW